MKWKVFSTSNNQEIYELWQGEKKLLSLDYHPFTNSARIEYGSEKRVFLLRKEGFLRNKTVLRNEYGIRIGQLGRQEQNEGQLELDNEKFFYRIQGNPLQLQVFRDETKQPVLSCELQTGEKIADVELKQKTKPGLHHHFLLIALCWYIFLPVTQSNPSQLVG